MFKEQYNQIEDNETFEPDGSEEAQEDIEQLYYYRDAHPSWNISPERLKKVHEILDKLEEYFLQNSLILTSSEDEEGNEIIVPHDYLNEENEAAVVIYENLRNVKKGFSNYLVQKHFEELLNGTYRRYVADQYDEDAEEILVPRVKNWFFDAENEYMQHLLKEDFGVDIRNYSPEIRKNFFDFLNTRKVENILELKKFTKKFGENGLKAFLAMEIDENIGKDILRVGLNLDINYKNPRQPETMSDFLDGSYEYSSREEMQKLPKANLVFQKISNLVDLAEQEKEDIKKLFKGKHIEDVDIRKQLLEKLREIIKNFTKSLDLFGVGKKAGQEKQKAVDKLILDLEQNKTEIILLAAIFKSFKAQEMKIKWEDIKDFNLDIKEFGSELGKEDKKEMLAVAERNWRQNEKLKDVVVQSLTEKLKNTKDQKFYILKYQGKTVSFVRFEKTDHGTLYAGSFNVDPEARGVGVGEEMMNRALITEGENNILEATVSPRLVAGTCYVEKVGFVLDGYTTNYHNTGEPLFSMQLNKKQNKKYLYRNEGKEDRISEEQIKKHCWTGENIAQIIGAETITLKFDTQNEFEKMKETMQKLLLTKNDNGENVEGQDMENKYTVTRYFQENREDKNNQNRYFVLEKMQS